MLNVKYIETFLRLWEFGIPDQFEILVENLDFTLCEKCSATKSRIDGGVTPHCVENDHTRYGGGLPEVETYILRLGIRVGGKVV
jgi:hypothetical protein